MSLDVKNKTYHRNLLEVLLKKHSHLIKGEILDIGSKNRRYDNWFQGKVTAVDLTPNPSLNVVFGDIEKGLTFGNESFDSILCLEVFEYLENYVKAISEIYRILKTGGHAIITLPFMYHDHEDKVRLTKNFLSSKLAGFSSVNIKTMGNAYTIIWDIFRKKWFLGKKGLRAKIIWWFCLWPFLKILQLKKIENMEDQYYSGLFVILKK